MTRPANLLVIMSDEHNPKIMGASGHPLVKTPNIDRLAAEGTMFTSAYTTSPVCVPARAAFAVGKYVHYVAYPPQLFDLERDPEELTDLAGDPAEVDRRAKKRQSQPLDANGGREVVLRRGDLGFTPPPGSPILLG